jgi:hypothetical protein
MKRLAQGFRVFLVAGSATVLAGCTAMQQTFGGWFGPATPTPAPAPQATPAAAVSPRMYYAGVEGLKVYSDSSTASKVVGELSLYEKVTRTKLERGYAYVESANSGAQGWVNNAQLIWRLPTAPKSAAGAPEAPEPEEPAGPAAETPQEPPVPEPTATAAAPLPAPTNTAVPAPPKAQATPHGVAPSIFDAY